MKSPRVSVVIPAHNQTDHLAEAIQSVLDQTYPNFEVIVVDDASSSRASEVTSQCDDSQVRYIVHKENRGLATATNTIIPALSGEIIAFLDADDMFHSEKLQAHAAVFEKQPDVGVTYSAHFDIDSSGTLLSMWRPPPRVTLSDLVLGLPFTPSDIAVRKDWARQANLFDGSYTFRGEALEVSCRLALAGCQFASVDRALNYHRHGPTLVLQTLKSSAERAVFRLEAIFSDPRCPQEVLALREKALGKTYLMWSYQAFAHNETSLGQEFIRKSIRLDRSILDMQASKYLEFLVLASIQDGGEHETPLRQVFEQLPPELAWITPYQDWAVTRGYLYRAVRAIMWGRQEQGGAYFAKAAALGARLDRPFCYALFDQLTDYEAEFGPEATQTAVQNLTRHLKRVGARTDVRWFTGVYFINRAFRDYHQGQYERVPDSVIQAVSSNPTYLANRGVLAILFRSLISLQHSQAKQAIGRFGA